MYVLYILSRNASAHSHTDSKNTTVYPVEKKKVTNGTIIFRKVSHRVKKLGNLDPCTFPPKNFEYF